MLKPRKLPRLFCHLALWAARSTEFFEEDKGRLKETEDRFEGVAYLIYVQEQFCNYIFHHNSRQAVAEVLWKVSAGKKGRGSHGGAMMVEFWEDYWFIEWRSELLSKKAGNLSTKKLNVETRNFNAEQEKTVHTSVNEAFTKAK